ncbi:hypothetical protein PAESOLCIP111_06267 [Paenibacillus solanacearum]|uniref:Alpha/beta hydrolase n=1 Tax=Paenibacillus solanacearum TaxID=2048548 RepID=A0A916K8Z9_9BACL|nr:hypothetical protein [Paenibacillus solanacearum]CAG7651200.1 hypothetical protein PAESOLCIP111_06267 [Paenibacillus solanacearum]
MIAPELGRLAVDRVVGVHVNAATTGFIPTGPVEEDVLASLSDAEKIRLGRLGQFMKVPRDPSPTPVGVAVFQQSDVAIRHYAAQNNHIVHWSEFDRGTHFPAIDASDLMISDIRAFFRGLSH